MIDIHPAAPQMTRLPVCICTDRNVGYDPDDLLALVIAAAALPLRLVVTSDEFGGGERARLARYLLNRCGRTGVVVIAGEEIEGAEARWVCDGLVPSDLPPSSIPIIGSTVEAVRTVLGEGHRAAWIGQGPGSKAADPMAVTAAAGLPFVKFDAVRVAIGPDARMHLDPNGTELRMSTAADYASFRGWVTMVVRHALESGMGYEPSLIGPSAERIRPGRRRSCTDRKRVMNAGGLQRDYLDQASLPHVRSNLYDCCNDPGALPLEQAERAHQLHPHCSSDCRVRARADQCRGPLAEQGTGETG